MKQPSTNVGVWRVAKIRIDDDPQLRTRWPAAVRGTGDYGRTVKAIASRLNSSNMIVKE